MKYVVFAEIHVESDDEHAAHKMVESALENMTTGDILWTSVEEVLEDE